MIKREDRLRRPADYPAICSVAEHNGLWVIADAAQSYGAKLDNRRVGTMGRLTTTSFFPAKPLGCYGDGRAVRSCDTGSRIIEAVRDAVSC
jgi:dTDP-4-amino-4,6-dideoxygalactose transaminase